MKASSVFVMFCSLLVRTWSPGPLGTSASLWPWPWRPWQPGRPRSSGGPQAPTRSTWRCERCLLTPSEKAESERT